MSSAPTRQRRLEQYVVFYPPEGIPSNHLFGYDLQKKAATEIGLTVLQDESCFVLFFGIPGTGKTEFTYSVVSSLNQDFGSGYSLIYAKCDELLRAITSKRATPEDVIQVLENGANQAWDNKPAVMVFDEIDSLSPPISNSDPSFALLTKWIRAYCEEEAERTKKTFTIGTTNWPNVVDFSVMRRVRISIFFDTPSLEVVTRIIEEQLQIQTATKVGKTVLSKLEKIGCVPLASDVVKGCQQFSRRCPDPHKAPHEQMCEDLVALIGGSLRDSVERYHSDFGSLIKKSQMQTEYWSKQFDLVRGTSRGVVKS